MMWLKCKCGCGQPCHGQYKNGHRPVKNYRVKDGKREHIARAEKAFGGPLPKGTQVHHVDLTKSEFSPLVICQDAAYHRLLHYRTKILRAGGNPNTDLWCSSCGPKSLPRFILGPMESLSIIVSPVTIKR